jgi:hypothetical protein
VSLDNCPEQLVLLNRLQQARVDPHLVDAVVVLGVACA